MKIQRIMMTICALLMVSAAAHGWDLPDDVELTEIRYNFEYGSSADGVTLKSDATTEVEPPEWTPSATKPVCFIAGNTVDIKAEVRRDNEYITQMSIYADHISEPGCIGDFGPTDFTYGDPNASNYDTKEMTCSWGSVPAGVGEKINYLYWYVDEINNQAVATTLIATTANSYYAVFDTPQAPMDKPWVDVLDYACEWAEGSSIADSVVSKITKQAYDTEFKEYDDGRSHFGDFERFYLTDFLTHDYADCKDMAGVVVVFSRALGVSANSIVRIYASGGLGTVFKYKSIIAIGESSPTTGYWSHHAFAGYPNIASIDSQKVYDACVQLQVPSARVPLGETCLGTYKYSLVDSAGTWTPLKDSSPIIIE